MGQAIRKSNWSKSHLAKNKKGKATAAQTRAGITARLNSTALFAATMFLSASLIFILEPMVAKQLLPKLGGTPSVWTTCMVFFQGLMLLGYLYAHILSSRFSVRTQAIVHCSVVAAAFFFIPINVANAWSLAIGLSPSMGVLVILTLTVGIPFFSLSANAPLLQNWFCKADGNEGKDPYFLYGASNLGSMIALFAYPLLLEPKFGLHVQSIGWAITFAVFGIAILGCAAVAGRAKSATIAPTKASETTDEDAAPAPTLAQYGNWVALALVPSSMMLGLTTYFTTDIATIPLLWLIPLALYLCSFIIVFTAYPTNVHKAISYAAPAVVLLVLFLMITKFTFLPMVSLFWHLSAFFLVTMACHGQMAKTRPGPKFLTQFYLCMSIGGFFGGIFNAAVAPYIFKTAAEYPIMLALSCFFVAIGGRAVKNKKAAYALDIIVPAAIAGVAAWFLISPPFSGASLEGIASLFKSEKYTFAIYLTYGIPLAACATLLFFRRQARLGLAVMAVTTIFINITPFEENILVRERSFFGILKVAEDSSGVFRTLTNGTTLHGRQALYPAFRTEPLTYYHRLGPVGDVMRSHNNASKPNLAFIGLGTGTLASYGQEGQNATFYEIDDAVVKIAKTQFTFLGDSKANVKIVMGDARLKMTEAKDHEYGIIFVDAFSSDAIPVHLLTKEAVEMFFQKLAPGGVLAIHTSNRYLNLEPVLGRIAKELHVVAKIKQDSGDSSVSKFASTWVAVAKQPADFGELAKDYRWMNLEGTSWDPLWTDDFTSVVEILR